MLFLIKTQVVLFFSTFFLQKVKLCKTSFRKLNKENQRFWFWLILADKLSKTRICTSGNQAGIT